MPDCNEFVLDVNPNGLPNIIVFKGLPAYKMYNEKKTFKTVICAVI